MKKIFLVNIILLSLLLFNSCGKKEKTQNADIKTNDDTKTEYVEYKCENMHCASCEETITTAVKKLDGIKEITADAKNKIVKVSFYKDKTNSTDIQKTINAAGYDTQDSKSGNKHNCDMEKE
ncbi:MAG: heavy-metal-associated domain-containing protein [Ignavibacteriae bacterium]|nr:heavy-metal-associated domain-containing protein [Ignavibacteriota bacterium]